MAPYQFHIIIQPSHVISIYRSDMAQTFPYHFHTFALGIHIIASWLTNETIGSLVLVLKISCEAKPLSVFDQLFQIPEQFCFMRRQPSQVDLKSGYPEFRSCSDQLNFFQEVSGSTHLLPLYLANWSASCQLGFLTREGHYVNCCVISNYILSIMWCHGSHIGIQNNS